MSKRNLFVSFAESDGGHSYLAARSMLEPGSVAHLIFRNSVADSLDAVTSGQANFAVVPAYNTITQWDGATLKALASGQFEIYGQVCMPTSYVLVAHKDYMFEFVSAYLNLREPQLEPTAEEAAKIYTRFLTRVFVGAQADEQYRGRLVRPDLSHAVVELSRNPLRVLEEMSRTELFKAMAAAAPIARGGLASGNPYNPLPGHVSGGTINIGTTPVLSQSQPITAAPAAGSPPATGPLALMETLQAPAALVAAGLLDAPGDPDGWDQPGSLGEIVALLRKLLVLLNVYSFGAPDLPENKTQYILVGRRGTPAPVDAIRAPASAPTRIMTLVRPSSKKSSADLWQKPRNLLTRRARDHGFVFDRPPLMLSPGNQRSFLFEGGKPRDGVSPNPLGFLERMGNWFSDTVTPGEAREKAKARDKSLRKALEKKQDTKIKDGTPEKFDVAFIGQYQTWCPEPSTGTTCWCCEEAHVDKQLEETGMGLAPLLQFLIASLIALIVLAMIIVPTYCTLTGACAWFGQTPTPTFEPRVEDPALVAPPPTYIQAPPAVKPTYPGIDGATTPAPVVKEPIAPLVKEPVVTAPAPKVEAVKPPPVFHVAFAEGKANLSSKAMDDIASAARTLMSNGGVVNLRVVSLGVREYDVPLWEQRFRAVRDELVRLGVPGNRIRDQRGPGPYLITIRPNQPMRPATTRRRVSQDLDSVPDPMSGEF